MKKGDLIRLVSYTSRDSVLLGNFEPTLREDSVPVGTIAVFMGSMPVGIMGSRRIRILVHGTIRWVYSTEYETM